MGNITFNNFDIVEGKINFLYTESEGTSGEIYFDLSPVIRPSNDLIALALSTLCGNKYLNIHFDLAISSKMALEISEFTKAQVTANEIMDVDVLLGQKQASNVLNFSGGFDSLAARCLMPQDVKLVSMDFGGRFSRERSFFGKFDTCIVSTNLVETPLRANSWSFMGIASILFSDYLGSKYYTFGGILEAGVVNFYNEPPAAKNASFPVFTAADLTNAPYVIGLTEVGTIKVLAHFNPELIAESLKSLANPGEEKRYRKQVLATIYENQMNVDFGLHMLDRPAKVHFKFGQNFAADFLSFYVIKHLGLEIASHTIANIPTEVVNVAQKLSLTFYEKVNPLFLENFPQPLLADYLAKLDEANVEQYNENDWKEFNEVKTVLKQYYNIL